MDAWFEQELSAQIPWLRAFAWRLTRRRLDWADDLVQDTVEQALLSSHKYSQGTNMRAWLATIMRCTFNRQLPRVIRDSGDVPLDGSAVVDSMQASVPADISGLLLSDAERLLSVVTDEQREAIILTCVLGVPVERAAQMLGVSDGTIKSRVHRGRARMAKAVADNDLPPRSLNAADQNHHVWRA